MHINFHHKKAKDVDSDGHIKLNYGPSKRLFPKMGWIVILLLAASPVLYFIITLLYSAISVKAPGYVTFEKIVIRAPHSGMVQKLWVKPGQVLPAQTKLIQLYDATLTAQQQMLTQQYDALSNNSQEYSQQVLADLENSRLAAEDEVAFYSKQFAQMKQLYDEQELGIPAYNSAKESLLRAQYRLQDIKVAIAKQYEQNLRDLSDENSYLGKKNFISLQLRALQEQLDTLTLRTPQKAKVIDRYVTTGEYVTVGSELLLLSSVQSPHITAYLDPKFADYANIGHKVTIEFANGEKIPGLVAKAPELSKQLPIDITGPVGTPTVKMLVTIQPTKALSTFESVEGLPVTVKF